MGIVTIAIFTSLNTDSSLLVQISRLQISARLFLVRFVKGVAISLKALMNFLPKFASSKKKLTSLIDVDIGHYVTASTFDSEGFTQ